MEVRVPGGEEFSVDELRLNKREAELILHALQQVLTDEDPDDEDPEYEEIEGEEDQIVIQIAGTDE